MGQRKKRKEIEKKWNKDRDKRSDKEGLCEMTSGEFEFRTWSVVTVIADVSFMGETAF
jgi:hypothetical protein